jgi:hypothetical protein
VGNSVSAVSQKRKTQKKPKQDDFESVAKRLECDLDEKRFREKLGKIARAKPKKRLD